MKILALEQELPGVDADRYAPLLEEEARRVWELYHDGTVREAYFRADQRAAVLILESPTVEQAQALLATLPLVRERLIRFTVIPLAPYTGFARLFAERKAER